MLELKETHLKFLELVQLCPFKSSPRFLVSAAWPPKALGLRYLTALRYKVPFFRNATYERDSAREKGHYSLEQNENIEQRLQFQFITSAY